ncbi:MAG: hypothetical protein QOC99_2183 [Acidobacteriota bacterium]|nr:hypothetical protein [Acidobacteriota bacterium]MDT7779671.1 hypothetical protein [Acidobacteriota bacterium]
MAQTVDDTQGELERRHAVAVRVVGAVFTFTLLLVVLALSGKLGGTLRFDPVTANSLRFVIVFLGVGAVVFRRTRFSAMRLQDIAALRGTTGLLVTLQTTTIYVAIIGGVIALIGFFISLMTGAGTDMIYLGVIAVAVLLYCYPRRAAWQTVVRALAQGGGDPVRAAKGTIA